MKNPFETPSHSHILYEGKKLLKMTEFPTLKVQQSLKEGKFDYKTIVSEEESTRLLRESLEKNNFEILEFGKRESTHLLEIYDIHPNLEHDMNLRSHEMPKEAKMLVSDVGNAYFSEELDERFDNVPEGKLPLVSKTFIAVAKLKSD